MKAFLYLLIGATMTMSSFGGLDIGKPAPNFTLPDTEGNERSLSDYKGKYVVLEWINHDCPYVKRFYDDGHMQALQEELGGDDLAWLSICSSAEGRQGYYTAEEWTKINAEKGTNADAVLLDPDGNVGMLYTAKTTPHMYIIDPEGTLIYQGAIDTYEDTEEREIEKNENYVRTALEEARAGKEVSNPDTNPLGCSVKYKK